MLETKLREKADVWTEIMSQHTAYQDEELIFLLRQAADMIENLGALLQEGQNREARFRQLLRDEGYRV